MYAQSSKFGRMSRFVTAIAAAAFLLHGCGGGSDGSPGATGPAGPAGPAGTPGKDATTVVKLSTLTADQYAATQFKVTVTGVTIASAPVVTFKVADQNGNPVVGLGSTSKASTATVASYPNLAFTLAKLVPPTACTSVANGVAIPAGCGGPSKWVSYLVTTVPSTTAAATAGRPSSDNAGTLVDNGDGTYKYTFYRDVTAISAQVAAMTLTGANVAADLGNLTYDANAVHRLGMSVSGNVPGTGTNTANAVQVVPAVPFAKPNNAIYDFIPATGKALALTDSGQRLIVDNLTCAECHGKLGGIPGTEQALLHGGARYDPKFCVTCHTDQRKYGQARVTSTNNVFPAGNTYVADGVTVGDFPVLIHRVHKGEELVKKGYNYAGVLLNETKFPQDIRNCTKCHDNTAPKAAPQADNYKNVPSRLACGACHDGINFATGTGTTNAGETHGHIGGARADDGMCSSCHGAADIPTYHVAVTPPLAGNALLVTGGNANTNAAWIASNLTNLPAGAIKVGYEVFSVSRNSAKQPVIVFRLLQNGVAKNFNTFDATKAKGTQEIWDNFMGSPSAYFVWAQPQDGITAPADFNASASGYIRNIWNGTATGTAAGFLSGPDANGYYQIVMTGVTVPDNAVMLSGGIGYTYNVTSALPLTQTNLAKYPTAAATATGLNVNMPNKTGGLIVVAMDTQKVATGYTARRPIVEDKRCNACHWELGMFTAEAFHAGQRNDGSTCSWCHTPNRTSSAWSADSTSFVHAIHAAGKRTTPFTWHAATTTASFANIGYPGVLSACETCHLPGTYDFSLSTSASAVPNRQYRTVGTGKYNGTVAGSVATFSISPYVTADNVMDYGTGFAVNTATGAITAAAGTTLVNSPITTACFSCHDSAGATAHMRTNGGSIYAARTTALATPEQCLICHGTGKLADIKTVHPK